jgi:RAVE protein 1 C terminal
MCFLQVPRATNDGEVRKFLAITDAKESFAWCVDFTPFHLDASLSNKLRIEPVNSGVFPSKNDLHIISAVDPMGWSATINSESLDSFTREVLITVSFEGLLQTWTTNFSRTSKYPRWLNLSSVPTNISQPSLAHGTSERKVAMGKTLTYLSNGKVSESGNELTIWDTKVSRFSVHEEYRKTFPTEDVIQDLDWTSTPDSQSILAVGFPRRVVLFCQQRYDYLNSGSMWISFMSFDMHG